MNEPAATGASPRLRTAQTAAWLVLTGVVMLLSTFTDLLSPRPDIGGVAALWLPNAVLAVAVLRNLDSPARIGALVAVFLGCGMLGAAASGEFQGSTALLIVDLVEVALVVGLMNLWGGQGFTLDSPIAVAVFFVAVLIGCSVGGLLAAGVALLPLDGNPTAEEDPLAVGVAWLAADAATFVSFGALLLALTGRGWRGLMLFARHRPGELALIILGLLVLGAAGYVAPSLIKAASGVALGNGGTLLIAGPLAVWVAFRHGPIGGACATAFLAVPGVYATAYGIGPFGAGSGGEGVFELQILVFTSAMTLLLTGAMSEGLRQRTRALEVALEEAIAARRPPPA